MTEHRYAELWRAHLHGPPAEVWTPQRVALLDAWALIGELVRLGIHPKLTGPETSVGGCRSAWEFAEREWFPFVRSTKSRDLEFVRLAACEIWKTNFSDRPSQEMLHDHYAPAQLAFARGHYDEAFVHYSILWRLAKRGLEPAIKVTADANMLMLPGDDFTTFTLDFAAATTEVTRCGGTHEAEPIEQLLAQFSDETPDWRSTITSDLVRVHVNCGRREEGERILSDALAQFSDRGAPYLALIDITSSQKHEDPEKLRDTIRLLDQALVTLPPEDVQQYDLRGFAAELRREFGLRVVRD